MNKNNLKLIFIGTTIGVPFIVAGQIILFGTKFKWDISHSTPENWSDFVTYLSGILSVIFSFATFITLILIERERKEGQRQDEAKRSIDNLITRNLALRKEIQCEWVRSEITHSPEYGYKNVDIILTGTEALSAICINFDRIIFKRLADYLSSAGDEFYNNESNTQTRKHIQKSTAINTQFRAIDFINNKDKSIDFSAYFKQLPQLFGIISNEEIESARGIFSDLDLEMNFKLINDAFEEFFQEHGYKISFYFRNQFYLFESISESSLSTMEIERWFKVYRSTLSVVDLIIMYYNCISKYSSAKYNSYIRDYDMLSDLEKVKFSHSYLFERQGYQTLWY